MLKRSAESTRKASDGMQDEKNVGAKGEIERFAIDVQPGLLLAKGMKTNGEVRRNMNPKR